MPANRPDNVRVAECAGCGRTAPLTLMGDGTRKGWVYIADEGVTFCPLHRQRLSEGWQDIIRIYEEGELNDIAAGLKPPPPPGAFEDE